MSLAALGTLSEGQVLSGVPLSVDQAAALNATRLVVATPEGGGWRVAAGQWVGAIRCGELDVRVAPKVGAVKVLELLARAHGVSGLNVDAGQLGLDDDASLSAVLAVLFEREARTALSRSQRGYRIEDQSLPVVRGRLRLVDQALRRFGAVVPIEVTVDEWTVDTDDNRRVRRPRSGCSRWRRCRGRLGAGWGGWTGCWGTYASRRAGPGSRRGRRPG